MTGMIKGSFKASQACSGALDPPASHMRMIWVQIYCWVKAVGGLTVFTEHTCLSHSLLWRMKASSWGWVPWEQREVRWENFLTAVERYLTRAKTQGKASCLCCVLLRIQQWDADHSSMLAVCINIFIWIEKWNQTLGQWRLGFWIRL